MATNPLKITSFSLLALIALTLAPGVSQAGDVRVATVDVNKVLNESTEAQAKRKVIDEQAAVARKKLDARKAELQALETKLTAAKVDQDSKEAEAFRKQAREFERMVKDSQEELRKAFLKSNKELTDKSLALIRSFAEKNGYDVVFDKNESGRGAVLFSKSIPDITDKVIAELKG
jgi:outer membrane protein